MPTAYIYRGTFQVRSGETLRYIEVTADGTLAPEVTKTYEELAGIGSLSVPAVSLTPSVSAPSLSGGQIGAIVASPVSLQPVVSPAGMSGVQVGSVAAAAGSLTPTVAVPYLAGVQVGSIGVAVISLQPAVAVGSLTGVEAASAPTPTPTISATGGNTTVSIALTNSVSGATSWSINWGTSAGSRTNTIDWATIQAATPNFPAAPFVHTGRTNGTTYYYSLVAVNGGGSTESAEVSAAAVITSGAVLFNFNADWSGFSSRVVLPQGGTNVVTPAVARVATGVGGSNGVRFIAGTYNNGTSVVSYCGEIYQTLNFATGTASFSAKGDGALEVYLGGELVYTTPTLDASIYTTYIFDVAATGSKEIVIRQVATAGTTHLDDITMPLSVRKLSFETADVTDSAGATWTKYIESGVDHPVTGEITSGVAGGETGNCLRVVPSIYFDGEASTTANTYITQTGLSIGRGIVTLRYKNENDANGRVFLTVGATTVGSANNAQAGWSTLSITVPSALTNATVQMGVDGSGVSYGTFYIDEVLIPAP